VPFNQNTPIMLAHGVYDPVVPYALGHTSYEWLKKMNYTVNWHTYDMQHSVSNEEIEHIAAFIKNTFLV